MQIVWIGGTEHCISVSSHENYDMQNLLAEAAPHDIQSASRSTVSLRSDSSDLLHDGGVRTRFDDVTEFEQRLSTLHRVEEEPPPYSKKITITQERAWS